MVELGRQHRGDPERQQVAPSLLGEAPEHVDRAGGSEGSRPGAATPRRPASGRAPAATGGASAGRRRASRRSGGSALRTAGLCQTPRVCPPSRPSRWGRRYPPVTWVCVGSPGVRRPPPGWQSVTGQSTPAAREDRPAMKIVVCVKYVPDATADRTSTPTTPPTARRRRAAVRARRVRGRGGAEDRRGRGEGEVTVLTSAPSRPPTPCARRCRWAPTPASTSSTTRSPAPTPPPPRWCWPRRSRRSADVDLVLTGMASTDGTMSVVPAMLAERLGLPQVTYASELDRRRRHRHDPPRRRRLAPRRSRRSAARAGQRHRPDQRAALPLVQGDHGGQEEAGARPGRWPTSASTPARSAWAPRGRRVESVTARPPREAGPGRHRRGRRRREARRVPRVHASSSEPPARPTPRRSPMAEVLVLVDHVDGAVRKTTSELLTIARRLGEPSAVFIGTRRRRRRPRWPSSARRRSTASTTARRDRLPGGPEGRGAGPAGRARPRRPPC